MQKTAALLLVVGIIIGAAAGYGGGFFTFQSTVTEFRSKVSELDSNLSKSQSELSDAKAQLSKAQTELSQTKSELSKTQADLSGKSSELERAKSTIGDLNSQLSKTQTDLSNTKSELSSKESDLAKAKTDLTKAEATLSQTQSELSKVKQSLAKIQDDMSGIVSKNVTIRASGVTSAYYGEKLYGATRSLLVFLSWSPRGGWGGMGFYWVTFAESDPATGKPVIGDIVILDVFSFTNVTISGGKVEARGKVSLTNRVTFNMGKEVVVTATDKGRGLAGEEVILQFPTVTPPWRATLTGLVDINA